MARLRSATTFFLLVETARTIFATIQSLVTTVAFTVPRGPSPTRRLLLRTTTTIAKTSAQKPFFLSPSGKAIKRCRVVAPETRRFGELQRSLAAPTTAAADEDDPDDLLKWERMFQQGERNAAVAANTGTGGVVNKLSCGNLRSEVRVVSFDLDNTLWNTSETIAAANDALAAFLDSKNITQPKRVEQIMGDLFQSNKARYCPIEKEDAKAPVLLTLLRKDAIQTVLEEYNGYDSQQAEELTDLAFNEWTWARHDAIPSHFAPSVQDCLRRIASIRTSSGHAVVIGAITDGNSDPTCVDGLSEYFQFCVNAERVGVSKPDKRVFLRAVSQMMDHPALTDVWSSMNEHGSEKDHVDLEKMAEDAIGPWWIHIGDDFVKDVVASKSLSMRSVWSRELVLHKFQNEATAHAVPAIGEKEKSVEDLVKQVSEMKVVRMQVGADDYLADSLQQEFADAVIDRFEELGNLLHDWHRAALPETSDGTTETSTIPAGVTSFATDRISESSRPPSTIDDRQTETSSIATKFCMFYGAKLPVVAKFCSACGEKQET